MAFAKGLWNSSCGLTRTSFLLMGAQWHSGVSYHHRERNQSSKSGHQSHGTQANLWAEDKGLWSTHQGSCFPRFIGALRTRGCKWEATERFGHLLKIKICIKLQGLASLDTLEIWQAWAYLLVACSPSAGAEGLGLSTSHCRTAHALYVIT